MHTSCRQLLLGMHLLHASRLLFVDEILLLFIKWGPNDLFCMPNRTNCVLLASVMSAALCRLSIQLLLHAL
jgi:hypothetical protein